MKILFIGGTGNISSEVSKLAISQGIDLYLLNRGSSGVTIPGTKTIKANIHDVEESRNALKDHTWDVVVSWIAFIPEHIQNDIELFRGKTKQYIFISSASIYQKPPSSHIITESTPLFNPFWQYSRDKIACEELLQKAYHDEGFPITLVRPSHTYNTIIPLSIGGSNEYTAIDRMKKGKKVIIHGDGTSLWTLTHAKDFAKGFNGLLGNDQSIGHAFHITSDEVLTWNQIYQIVADTAGAELNAVCIPTETIMRIAPSKKGSLWGDKSYSTIFDNSKIKSFVPDFKATISFKAGFSSTLEWFEAEQKRMLINPDTDAMMDEMIKAYDRLI